MVGKGPWTQQEDALLKEHVRRQNGANAWGKVAEALGTRSAKQCRERWHQNLKPGLNHEPITEEESRFIVNMVASRGKRWAEIARSMSGRSDNMIKNWWNGSNNRRQRQCIDDHHHHQVRRRTSASSPTYPLPQQQALPDYDPQSLTVQPPFRYGSAAAATLPPPSPTSPHQSHEVADRQPPPSRDYRRFASPPPLSQYRTSSSSANTTQRLPTSHASPPTSPRHPAPERSWWASNSAQQQQQQQHLPRPPLPSALPPFGRHSSNTTSRADYEREASLASPGGSSVSSASSTHHGAPPSLAYSSGTASATHSPYPSPDTPTQQYGELLLPPPPGVYGGDAKQQRQHLDVRSAATAKPQRDTRVAINSILN